MSEQPVGVNSATAKTLGTKVTPAKATKGGGMVRPDFSQYVIHFTTSRKPCSAKVNDATERGKVIVGGTAYDRLVSILQGGEVWATPMPWTNKPAVCFTECTWASLLDHASRYSPFGIGFSKAFLFSREGGPAIYLRQDLFEAQVANRGFHDNVMAFITPFRPFYAPVAYRNRYYGTKKPVDYTHEREWRVPHDLAFRTTQVEFVIVDTYEDMAKFPKDIKDAIGRKKFIIMDEYRKVEQFWPTHRVAE